MGHRPDVNARTAHAKAQMERGKGQQTAASLQARTVGHVAGIKVMIFYHAGAPPHVHLDGGDDAGVVVDILTPRIRAGIGFTASARKAALDWIRSNETALLANYARAQYGYPLIKIPQTSNSDPQAIPSVDPESAK